MTTSPDITNPFKLPATFLASLISHPKTDNSPTTKWENLKKLGEGGQGSVYLQIETTTKQLRAVKKLYVESFEKHGLDVRRELRHLISVMDRKELFVEFLGWYQDDYEEFLYIAMEYVPHGDLGEYIKAHGPCGEDEAKEITRQLLDGLVVLHQRHICHRDLKPQNVLIASPSPIRIKLADFGISKSTIGTNLHTRVGTQGFLAPELQGFQHKGYSGSSDYTNAVDMWALGCLVHCILTGTIPFTVQDPVDNTTITGVSPQGKTWFDMGLFSVFCNHGELPVEELRARVGGDGVGFIRGLLVVDPRGRMSAGEAREHGWLS